MNRRDLLLLVGAAMTPSRPERPARVFRPGVLQVTPPGPGYLRSASGLSGTAASSGFRWPGRWPRGIVPTDTRRYLVHFVSAVGRA